MNTILKHMSAVAFLSIALWGTSAAEEKNTSITQTSPNHTEIVIRTSNPSALAEQKERARLAEERRERQKERDHELELARINAGQSESVQTQPVVTTEQRPSQPVQASIEERQRRHAELNQPPAFFNGGRWTGLEDGFFLGGGYGFWGPGFNQGFVGPGFNRGYRNRGYRNSRMRSCR